MSDTLNFYGVSGKQAKVFNSNQLKKKLGRKAALKLLKKGASRLVPFLGTALLIKDLYDLYEDNQPARWGMGWKPCEVRLPPICAGGKFANLGWRHPSVPCGGIGGNPNCSGSGSTTTEIGVNEVYNPNAGFLSRHAWWYPFPATVRGKQFEVWTRVATPAPALPKLFLPQIEEVPLVGQPYPRPKTNPNVPFPFLPMWPKEDFWPDHPAAEPKPEEETKPDVPAPSPFPFEVPKRVPMPSPHWDYTFAPGPAVAPSVRPGPGGGVGPKPSPKPAPTPLPLPSPSPAPPGNATGFVPLPSPPKPGEKERKFRTRYSPQALLDVVSEGAEMVDCLYDQLPSVAKAAEGRALFAQQMKEFWAIYRKVDPKTAAAKSALLKKKPRWDASWADPLAAAKKDRKLSLADNSKRFGIDFADKKLGYIYNHFSEVSASVVNEAIKCAALNIAVDAVIGPLLANSSLGSPNKAVLKGLLK